MHPLNQKIIELLPDLKNLTFGCEISFKEEEEYTGGNTHEVKDIVVKVIGKRTIDDSIYIKGIKTEYDFESEQDFEILGCPPQLSDVLRAVYRTMTEMTRHDGEKQEAILSMLKWYVTPEGDVREPMWNLSLGLNDQPESTKQFILSILNK